MSRRRFLGASMGIAICVYAPVALACGDKFLLLGRSIRYEEAYAAKHPASVLVYTNPATGFSAVSSEVAAILRKAGHTTVLAEGKDGLQSALRGASFDVVFADAADVAGVGSTAKAMGAHAVLVGVVYNATGKEIAEAERQYTCLLKAKGKDKHVLAVVNEIVRSREKGKPVECRKV